MNRVHLVAHPMIQHKLTFIRDKNTGSKEFRDLVEEVAMFLAYEVTRNLPLAACEVETPVAKTTSQVIAGKKLGIIPILRAGLGMVSGILRLIPASKVGHIGIYRDPDTLLPVEYYVKLPSDVAERELIVVDPMLATGGSAVAAINLLKQRGAQSIKFMCLIAAPLGIEKLHRHHPEVEIFTAAIDSHLNEHAYIVPGLGDAGDRLFGTK